MNVSRRLAWMSLWGALGILSGAAAGAVELAFDPESPHATYPETFTVSVIASDVDHLRGYEIEIAFDDGYVDFLSAQRGALFSNYSPPSGLYWDVVDGIDHVHVQCFVIPADECVDGPGEILRLTFATCDAQGTSPLHFVAATVRDCAGAPILPLVMHDGVAVIGPEATLYFDPDPKVVWGDDPFSVSMMTGPVDSLRGFQVYLEYDPTAVDFDSALVGDLLAASTYPLWWYVNEESPSRVRIEGVVLGPHLAVDGPGELVDLYFTAVSFPDTSEIVFSQWRVWDVDTVEFLPVAVDDGLVIAFPGLQDVAPNGRPQDAWAPLVLQPAGRLPGTAAAFTCEAGGCAADLRADVLDVGGRRVIALAPRLLGATSARLEWNGRDAAGAAVAPGVYFLRARAGERMGVGRIVLVR